MFKREKKSVRSLPAGVLDVARTLSARGGPAPVADREPLPAPIAPKAKDPTPSDKVYNFILDKLLSRQWPVKCKIMTENELSAELKVSRVAVREAVERLCALGLLIKRQGAGTFVSEPHVDQAVKSLFPMLSNNEMDVRQILEFRRYFEYGNVILFMKYHDPADVQALEDNYQTMISLGPNEAERSSMLDFDFHQLLARGTKNQFVAKISDILVEIMRSHHGVMYYTTVTQGNAIIYHNEIIRAIRNGDGDVAAMLMLRHIDIAIECLDTSWMAAEYRRNMKKQGV